MPPASDTKMSFFLEIDWQQRRSNSGVYHQQQREEELLQLCLAVVRTQRSFSSATLPTSLASTSRTTATTRALISCSSKPGPCPRPAACSAPPRRLAGRHHPGLQLHHRERHGVRWRGRVDRQRGERSAGSLQIKTILQKKKYN